MVESDLPVSIAAYWMEVSSTRVEVVCVLVCGEGPSESPSCSLQDTCGVNERAGSKDVSKQRGSGCVFKTASAFAGGFIVGKK